MRTDILVGSEEGPNSLVLAIVAIVIVLAIFTGCRLL